MTACFVAAGTVVLACANGANDVAKAVATLVGSRTATSQQARIWGAICAGAGAIAAVAVAGAMGTTIAGSFPPAGASRSSAVAMAPLLGSAAWVWLATRCGLPVSTTHAIVGALVGTSLAEAGSGGVAWSAMGRSVVLPLLLSPAAALVSTWIAVRAVRTARGAGIPAACVCVAAVPAPRWQPAGGAFLATGSGLPAWTVATGSADECRRRFPDALAANVSHLHWVSSGAVGFARSLNDAPKLAALAAWALAPAHAHSPPPWLFALVAGAMLAGGLAAGGRVTWRLAWEITPLDDRDGLVANLVTAALVALGAVAGLPMSTTHVSAGSLAGVGTARGAVAREALRDIALAWLATVPAAAGFAALAIGLARAWF